MRILILCHAFNSLTQRVHIELRRWGHEVSVEFDINDDTTIDAVGRFAPDLIVAPYLKRAIPDAVWRRHVCLVLHPGPLGDRGPAALDWAILRDVTTWGVTVLQADGEFDAGPVWAHREFPLRRASKSSLYRDEVTRNGSAAVLDAVDRFDRGLAPLFPENVAEDQGWQGRVPPAERSVDWERDDTEIILRRMRAADGFPGLAEVFFGERWRFYGGIPEPQLRGQPGALLATRDGAVCRATTDGAIWIAQARCEDDTDRSFKLPAALALGQHVDGLPEVPAPHDEPEACREIDYRESNGVGYLRFEFYNGAMSTDQCERLRAAWRAACDRPTRAIVLLGGRDFWSNGLHLNCIEAADSPADESWRNINAMDDLAEDIIRTTDRLTVAAMRGNAGAGGVFLALAADHVFLRSSVVLNPHYRSMGNLYGSEFWTYLLPRRIGDKEAQGLIRRRLPMGAAEAVEIGLADAAIAGSEDDFLIWLEAEVADLVEDETAFADRLAKKRTRLSSDEAARPLSAYREDELDRMKLNFYGFDPSYHVARHRFVHKHPKAWTPVYLARHRAGGSR